MLVIGIMIKELLFNTIKRRNERSHSIETDYISGVKVIYKLYKIYTDTENVKNYKKTVYKQLYIINTTKTTN